MNDSARRLPKPLSWCHRLAHAVVCGAIIRRHSMLGGLLLGAALPATTRAQGFVVVVNAANPMTALTRAQVSDIFLKKITRWTSENPIVPVDQERASKVREAFSKAIHLRPTAAIATYWQTQIFSGSNVPPVIRATDTAVLDFVRANPNAIGYVSTEAPLGPNLRALVIPGL